MDNRSALTIRRFAGRQVEPTRQLVTFQLQQEWFALFINVVQKVVMLGKVYGDVRGTGVSLTLYQEREILVVDIGRRIFGQALLPGSSSKYLPSATESKNIADNISNVHKQQAIAPERFLLVVQPLQGELVGLPIDSPPSLRRVPESAFSPLPSAYLSQGYVQCVSSVVIQSKDEPPLFLLNPDRLVEAY